MKSFRCMDPDDGTSVKEKTDMRNCEERAKARYIQVDRAARLDKKAVDTTIPYYDEKKNLWCLGEGADKREDAYLDRLIQEFAGYKMKFRYTWNGETVTRRVFAEVLEDMITRYESLSIEGFEEDYNKQQIEWLGIIKEKLMKLKGKKG